MAVGAGHGSERRLYFTMLYGTCFFCTLWHLRSSRLREMVAHAPFACSLKYKMHLRGSGRPMVPPRPPQPLGSPMGHGGMLPWGMSHGACPMGHAQWVFPMGAGSMGHSPWGMLHGACPMGLAPWGHAPRGMPPGMGHALGEPHGACLIPWGHAL